MDQPAGGGECSGPVSYTHLDVYKRQSVILMDEPFGHLDAQTRYLMEEEIERICSTEKRTVVFVTNNIEEAIYLADRIILLTNCPATVKKEYVVDLPRPRSYVSPEFLELRELITSEMDEMDL